MRKLVVAMLGFGLALAPGMASPCAYDGQIGNPFAFTHPAALTVALAINQSVLRGQLVSQRIDQLANPLRGLTRAMARVDLLRARLDAAAAADRPRFSLLFVESDLWSRFQTADGALRVRHHTPGPDDGEATLLTGEAVLDALLAGQLTPDQAFDQTLLVADGDPVQVAALRRWLDQGLAPRS